MTLYQGERIDESDGSMTVWHQFALGDNEASLFKLTLFFFILTTVILWFTQFEEHKELIMDPFFFFLTIPMTCVQKKTKVRTQV